MAKVEAPINKVVLLWARQAMGYEPEEVAHRLHIRADKLRAWEAGATRPTLRQLERISDLYRQPLVTFFQKAPPDEPEWPADYRRFPGGERRPLSPRTRTAIWEARWRQSVALDLRRELGVEFTPSVKDLVVSPDPEAAAEAVRAKIGPTMEAQAAWAREPDLVFKRWRRILETLGVLVFRLDFPKEDARGFSLPENLAPIIAVSSKDYRSATVFSLFHELGHLLFDDSSTCNDLEFRTQPESDPDRVEWRCNHFAGALLVPAKELLAHDAVRTGKGKVWDDAQLMDLSRYFGVSREVILRRLVILGRATDAFYREWRRKQQETWKDWEPRKRGFAVPLGYARKRINQQGEAYVRTILDAYAGKIIGLSEASEYLDVKTKHVRQIEQALGEAGEEA